MALVFQAEMFIGLLLRAMKNDVNLKRVSAFSKRVLQVSDALYSLFACSLFLSKFQRKVYKENCTTTFHFIVNFILWSMNIVLWALLQV